MDACRETVRGGHGVKLIITRGLPGSGKTTRARAWVAEDPMRRARVNRDDLRTMAHDGVYLSPDEDNPGTERAIMAVRDATISALLKRGVDVVCDDTNLPARVARDLRKVAVLAGAEFEVWDMTDVDVEICVERDAARPVPVGETKIRDRHMRFIHKRPHPLPITDEPETTMLAPYVRPSGTPSAVLVDIDGTVALMCARSPYDETRVHEDLPNAPVIATVRALAAAGHRIVFVSARTEGCRATTESWLKEHVGVEFDTLHLRPVGDSRRDSVVKGEIFNAHIRTRYDVLCVLDDRRQVVDMWRSIGLTVLHVADGTF